MPLVLASVGQTSGLLMVRPHWILVASAGVGIVAAVLIRGGMKRFTRDRVASRL